MTPAHTDPRTLRLRAVFGREGDDVVAYDLCSTNGTRRGNRSVRRAVLRGPGDELYLAGRRGVTVRWQPVS